MGQSEFVVGFLFSTNRDRVALIRKRRPARLAGRWNGIGGKIENGEDPYEALVREYQEEASIKTTEVKWLPFARLHRDDCTVHFFVAYNNSVDDVVTASDEEVRVFKCRSLPKTIISDLYWLLPLARTIDRLDPANLYTICPEGATLSSVA